MNKRLIRANTLKQRKGPKVMENVIVISPNSDRGWMWRSYASDSKVDIEDLFNDHLKYLEKHGWNRLQPVKFTAFAIRERGIPIYKLALVFESDEELDIFLTKSNFSFEEVREAEWNIHFGEERELYLEGKLAQVEAAYYDLVSGKNLYWF